MATLPEVLAPFPVCSDLVSLRFDGRMLILSIPGGVKQYPAVRGKFHGDFSVRAQQDRNLGPIPEGTYWIDPEQLWTAGPLRNWLSQNTPLSYLWSGWGDHRITIHPPHPTQTYGRGGFFIHGGSHQGSAGCIHITGSGMETFVADLKAALSGLPSCSVLLTVRYP
jgi:hypothetical protein